MRSEIARTPANDTGRGVKKCAVARVEDWCRAPGGKFSEKGHSIEGWVSALHNALTPASCYSCNGQASYVAWFMAGGAHRVESCAQASARQTMQCQGVIAW
jgi:hypothetical protein